jgi:hypothetical protein
MWLFNHLFPNTVFHERTGIFGGYIFKSMNRFFFGKKETNSPRDLQYQQDVGKSALGQGFGTFFI